jgi:hypothetical protein
VPVNQYDLVNPLRDRAEDMLEVARFVLSRDNNAYARHNRDPVSYGPVVSKLIVSNVTTHFPSVRLRIPVAAAHSPHGLPMIAAHRAVDPLHDYLGTRNLKPPPTVVVR